MNTAVGSGSLITYPALLLVGLPPVIANVTNTVGLAPGAIAGAWTYRRELKRQRSAALWLAPISVVGAVAGASLLLTLPSATFNYVVPLLVIVSALLVGVQPLIVRLGGSQRKERRIALGASVAAASVYGGYFSAAQGIILLGILGIFRAPDLQAQNALKNLLQAVVNVVAAVFFLVTTSVNFAFVACLAVGSLLGAPVGAWLARTVPQAVFRSVIVVLGSGIGIYLLFANS